MIFVLLNVVLVKMKLVNALSALILTNTSYKTFVNLLSHQTLTATIIKFAKLAIIVNAKLVY